MVVNERRMIGSSDGWSHSHTAAHFGQNVQSCPKGIRLSSAGWCCREQSRSGCRARTGGEFVVQQRRPLLAHGDPGYRWCGVECRSAAIAELSQRRTFGEYDLLYAGTPESWPTEAGFRTSQARQQSTSEQTPRKSATRDTVGQVCRHHCCCYRGRYDADTHVAIIGYVAELLFQCERLAADRAAADSVQHLQQVSHSHCSRSKLH